MLVRLLRYHFEEERLRTESEHCTKFGQLTATENRRTVLPFRG